MAMNKGLTIRMGQTHVNRWTHDLLRRIEEVRSILPSSSPTGSGSRTGPRCTRRSGTSRTAASRSCSRPEDTPHVFSGGGIVLGGGGGRSWSLTVFGWFTFGLGGPGFSGPGHLPPFFAMEEHAQLIRAYGAREIATGIGILTQEDPTP